MEIIELREPEELAQALPILQELRPELTREDYFEILEDLRPKGYRLFAVRDGSVLRTVAGVEIQNNLYDRRHLRVHEMVTAESARSRGFGAALMRFLEGFAREQGCVWIVLSSGVERLHAHRFYRDRAGYAHLANVFMKRLGAE